mmetsp:Transcript_14423/g.34135  ORF Transcript_14423/g.34135 Transcript_14423/m.34135 type:complete len:204 (+) Transcript_14423:380-991(+)
MQEAPHLDGPGGDAPRDAGFKPAKVPRSPRRRLRAWLAALDGRRLTARAGAMHNLPRCSQVAASPEQHGRGGGMHMDQASTQSQPANEFHAAARVQRGATCRWLHTALCRSQGGALSMLRRLAALRRRPLRGSDGPERPARGRSCHLLSEPTRTHGALRENASASLRRVLPRDYCDAFATLGRSCILGVQWLCEVPQDDGRLL